MSVTLATKTMELIQQTLNADNCGQFRQNLKQLLPKMEDAYRPDDGGFRSHQGASSIGTDCGRALQLKWKWVNKPTFDERILRLFNRGHLEEARFLSILKCFRVCSYGLKLKKVDSLSLATLEVTTVAHWTG